MPNVSRPLRPALARFPHRLVRRIALAALLGLAGLALSCASPPPQAAVETGELIFWEILPPGGATPTAHLLGTIHYGRSGFAFDPAIRTALDEADVLVLELDLGAIDEVTVGASVARAGLYHDGRTLHDVLAPETMTKLEAYLEERSLDSAPYLRMEPWLAVTLLQDAAVREEGYESEQGIEQSLTAVAEDKPIRGLETLEEQLGALDGLPLATQEALVLDMVDAAPGSDAAAEAAATIHLLLEAWEKGDLDLIEGLVLGSDEPALAPYYDALFTTRNRRMTQRLVALLDRGERLFVAVGTGHMVGRDNVVVGLQEMGFEVRRVARSALPEEGE